MPASPWSGAIACHPISAGLVYVEVPKAGCTSIKWALAPYRGEVDPTRNIDIHHWFGYLHAADLSELRSWLRSRWRKWFRFTVVRDPVARFESFFYGLLAEGPAMNINEYLERPLEFDPWMSDYHAIPQTSLIGTDLAAYDFVGRTEDMPAVQRVIRRRMKNPGVIVPHANRYLQERDALTRTSLDKLHAMYRTDFEVLGYD